MTPNGFAFVALLSWPLVALFLYSTRPIAQATIWTILGGYLLLPVGTAIKIEGIPPFDKTSIPTLAAIIGCVLVTRRFPRIGHRFGLPEILMLMLLVGAFLTSEFNWQPTVVGARILPGLDRYDGLSAAFSQLICIIPFILARQFLGTPADTASILRILLTAGLAYSPLMLFEVRMSPQLHTWIYGYFPHYWLQMVRDGGFRPVVFLGHGLIVAFFAMTTAVAAAALWRTNYAVRLTLGRHVLRLSPGGVTAYLSVVLFLCKSLGSLVYGAVLVPLVRFASPRLQLRVAAILSCIALSYPMLRTMDLVPTASLIDLAKSVSADRAGSLKTRFDNEKVLLERASEHPWFGWGRWGRSFAFDEFSGKETSITDARWTITLGTYGLFGFIAEFGLLALSVFRAASAFRFAGTDHDRRYLAALALIVAIGLIDLLPNAFLSPWTWLLAGALLGRAEGALRHVPRLTPAIYRPTDELRPELTG